MTQTRGRCPAAPRPAFGVRLVAGFEAGKGLLVLGAGFGLMMMLHSDLQQLADELVRHLHLNPASRYPRIFLDLVGHAGNVRLWRLAVFAFVYAALRLAEAYGLWRDRQWAQWVAVVSGGMYLPFETYELSVGVTCLKAATFVINVAIVAYLVAHLRRVRAGRR